MIPEFLEPLARAQPDWQTLTDLAGRSVVAFVLVVARLSGLMSISPVFSNPGLPVRIRALLVVALAFAIVPALAGMQTTELFRRWDDNQDGRLTSDEVPESWQDNYRWMQSRARLEAAQPLTRDQFRWAWPAPRTPFEFLGLAVGEFILGLGLAAGMMIILSAATLAGEIVDLQTGLALGQIFNPQLGTSSSLTSTFLQSLGLLLFLTSGGHILMLTGLMDTFRVWPVGFASIPLPLVEFLINLGQEMWVLTVQLAAPVILTMGAVGVATGIIGHTVTNINFIDVGIPTRVLAGWVVLLFSLAGVGVLLVDRYQLTLERMLEVLLLR